MDCITVGEMVIDFLPGREKGSYIRNAGGAPANVAISIARNGLHAGMYCKLGNDDFGYYLNDTLQENGVKLLTKEYTDEAVTTMAFVTLDEKNDRSFTFARRPGADMMLDKNEIMENELVDATIIHAGSCSLSEGKAVEATKHALKEGSKLGKMISFDVNYRNLMWNDDKNRCSKKVLEILKYVDFLKISEEEIDMIGGYDNVFNVMEEYDISVVVLTLGDKGAELFYDKEVHLIAGYEADIVADTTGAGDAFWGGFLSELLIQKVTSTSDLNVNLLKRAIIYGNVSGSLAVKEKGAIASLPTRTKIEKFLKEKNIYE